MKFFGKFYFTNRECELIKDIQGSKDVPVLPGDGATKKVKSDLGHAISQYTLDDVVSAIDTLMEIEPRWKNRYYYPEYLKDRKLVDLSIEEDYALEYLLSKYRTLNRWNNIYGHIKSSEMIDSDLFNIYMGLAALSKALIGAYDNLSMDKFTGSNAENLEKITKAVNKLDEAYASFVGNACAHLFDTDNKFREPFMLRLFRAYHVDVARRFAYDSKSSKMMPKVEDVLSDSDSMDD